MQPNGFTPPQAAYEGPKPFVAAEAAKSPFQTVVTITGEIIRLSVVATDDAATATLEHDYPGTDMVGKGFEFDGIDYEVTGQNGRSLTIEAI